jgi:plasmid stabilization system protein ParE
LRLAPKDRAELAAKLVASVNAFAESESAWAAVVTERAERIHAVTTVAPVYLKALPVHVRFELAAEVDLERAATWYEEHPGQVEALLVQIRATLERIHHSPTSFGLYYALPRELGVRRAFVRDYPYTVVYTMVGNEVRIVAVAHAYRTPVEGEISMEALITVEDWLAMSGVRALGLLAVGAALATPTLPT